MSRNEEKVTGASLISTEPKMCETLVGSGIVPKDKGDTNKDEGGSDK
jgi:hypothetical protein